MSLDATREVMTAYLDGHDLTRLADDAVFHDTASGRDAVGRDAIEQMLEGWYHGAFEAHADTKRLILAEDAAVLQAEFIGTHIGEFEGVPATGRQVRVPFCVVYDVSGGAIRRADIYLQATALMAQLGASDIREDTPV